MSIAALIGIGVRMRDNDTAETHEVIEEQPVTEETEVVVEVPEEVVVTEPEDDGIVIDLSTDDVEITGEGDEIVQELQEEPEIPEVPTVAKMVSK